MRERLVVLLVGLSLAIIALYGVPRAYFVAGLLRDVSHQELVKSGELLANSVEDREQSGGVVDEAFLSEALVAADRVSYRAADGSRVSVGADPSGDQALTVTEQLAGGGELTLESSAQTQSELVLEGVQGLFIWGFALALLAAVIAYVVGRRFSQPFVEIAVAARSLSYGQFDVEPRNYRIPEANELAMSLRSTAFQLGQLEKAEREFAANASHQLRSPITALRLQLEDISLWPETTDGVREEIRSGLAELARLNGSIDDLLALASGRRQGQQIDVDLVALMVDTAERWRPRLTAQSRGLVVVPGPVMPARLIPGPVIQVIDVLIENARVHGRGAITVAARDLGSRLSVTVSDEGKVDLGSEIFRRGVTTRPDGEGHGVGLAVASELAELAGAHLAIEPDAETTTFALWVPKPDSDSDQTLG